VIYFSCQVLAFSLIKNLNIEYKERHAVECMFGKLKHYRRIAMRYDKKLLITWGCYLCLGAFMVEMKRQQNLG
jgi:hypothetical protein